IVQGEANPQFGLVPRLVEPRLVRDMPDHNRRRRGAQVAPEQTEEQRHEYERSADSTHPHVPEGIARMTNTILAIRRAERYIDLARIRHPTRSIINVAHFFKFHSLSDIEAEV